MKLSKDVAHEVALMTKRIACSGFENDAHVQEVAEKIVKARALADTIEWYKYMRGEQKESI